MPLTCPHCSYVNLDHAHFCARCGNRLQAASQTVVPPHTSDNIVSPPTATKQELSRSSDASSYRVTPDSEQPMQAPSYPPLAPGLRHLVPGQILSPEQHLKGRYKIEKLVAASERGAVYRAIDIRFNR